MKTYITLMAKAAFLLTIIVLTLILYWGFRLNQKIDVISENGWFPPSSEVFALGETLYKGAYLNNQELNEILISSNFSKAQSGKNEKTFKQISGNECLFNIKPLISDTALFDTEMLQNCLVIELSTEKKILIGQSLTGHILFLAQNNQFTDQITLPSYPIAQYQNNKPYLSEKIQVGDVPLHCLQAITAIEDKNFLHHHGISIRGILRAIVKNIRSGRKTEGASTITQQLVKNYFLSHERTYKRKFKEIIMAVLLEVRFSKDEILANYLNVIYLGQSGNFQIIGYQAASKHYFQKPIGSLNLQECALIASIVNSPGLFNPFTKSKNALTRRSKVLKHMFENKTIEQKEYEQALSSSLPKKAHFRSTDSSAYYLDAIDKKLTQLNLDTRNGLKIYTSISPLRQIHAQKVLSNNLKKIESSNEYIKSKKIKLQASLINVDLKTGHIKAIIGGRSFNQTQYNRPLESKRQVGSIMKPFVYITALENKNQEGEPYTALSTLPDKLITHKYEGQSWTPKNYSRTYKNEVPLFYALKNSLNAPTAALGMQLGVSSVIEVAQRLGVQTKLKPFPSLFLGALELNQLEVLQAYSTIANNGVKIKNSFIQKVTDNDGKILFENKKNKGQQVLRSEISSQIISILQQTTLTGTARSLKSWRKFSHPIAGKTGTTNNTKDAWFAGFTPDSLTLVWLGHDQNLETQLTGASGALPIWSDYMKKVLKLFPIENSFSKNTGTKDIIISAEKLKDLVPEAKEHELINIDLNMPVHFQFDEQNDDSFERSTFEENL